ncbi:putative disease resistance protein [Vitis vinifera]|uniref:Putative disease resistance protein n=1 Tax=Vitis vinifera TaxID=29760 RepID=A0A438FC81_VITVI|nr:putative disease resistance protein [Vitis vinifera]
MELKPKRKAESGAVLLVLDDVWCGSESLLTKFKFQISESKVLVTSRNEFPEFGSKYDLELLNDDDAMALFRHSAIAQNGSCNYTPTDRLVKKVWCSTADSGALQGTSTGPGSSWQITPWAACRDLEKRTDEIIRRRSALWTSAGMMQARLMDATAAPL